jgi:hypothetical protein
MKLFFLILGVLLITVCLLATPGTEAQVASLEATGAVICKDVVDLKPVGVGNSFSASVGKLYCFTQIKGAHEPTAITHVWYFGKTERARVSLAVDSESWRTKSSKKIQLHETGKWHVHVLGSQGELLQTVEFEITYEYEEGPQD